MIAKLRDLYAALEERRLILTKELETCSDEELHFQPGPDRWSMVMVLEHIVMGERGVRLKGAEISGQAIEADPQADALFKMVIEILDKDMPVDVPDPKIEPVGDKALPVLLSLWDAERKKLGNLLDNVTSADLDKAVASHAVTGSLNPVRTLELALAHFDTHHRQIHRIREEYKTSKSN